MKLNSFLLALTLLLELSSCAEPEEVVRASDHNLGGRGQSTERQMAPAVQDSKASELDNWISMTAVADRNLVGSS